MKMKAKSQTRGLSLLAALVALFILGQVPAGQSRHQAAPPLSGAVASQLVGDSLDAQTGLVLAPGFQVVRNNCVRCHSSQLITAKRATREGWEGTIRWMQLNQGLGDLGKEEAVILDYLAKHYAPTQEGRRPPLKNIEWYRLEN
jgi:Quinohemoprotein amine dehydrogenase A, alpha subunit, haem binding